MFLAGDVGGTKSTLILFSQQGSSFQPAFRTRMGTQEFSSAVELVESFLAQASREGIAVGELGMASLACAGAVVEGRVVTNNLPWTVETETLAKCLRLPPNRMLLLNDLVATASSLDHLTPNESAGAPLLRMRQVIYSSGTKPVIYVIGFYRSERHSLFIRRLR